MSVTAWGAPLRRALVATDLSFRSRVALRRVPFLPLARGAEVRLVLVLARGSATDAARKETGRLLDREAAVLETRLRRARRGDVRLSKPEVSGRRRASGRR